MLQYKQVYGGQLIGQALAATCKTVDCLKMVHSLHASFIIVGNFSPIDYQVYLQCDGKDFLVDELMQNKKVLSYSVWLHHSRFSLLGLRQWHKSLCYLASFQGVSISSSNSAPKNSKPCSTLFVANLGPSCTQIELLELFSSGSI